jgi:hypothetical protein
MPEYLMPLLYHRTEKQNKHSHQQQKVHLKGDL